MANKKTSVKSKSTTTAGARGKTHRVEAKRQSVLELQVDDFLRRIRSEVDLQMKSQRHDRRADVYNGRRNMDDIDFLEDEDIETVENAMKKTRDLETAFDALKLTNLSEESDDSQDSVL